MQERLAKWGGGGGVDVLQLFNICKNLMRSTEYVVALFSMLECVIPACVTTRHCISSDLDP